MKIYRKTVKIPISITWHQELVDDGPGGKDFYMRITPHINLGGKKGAPTLKYVKGPGKQPGTFWQKTEYNKAVLRGKLNELIKEVEKDAINDTKQMVAKSVTSGQNKVRQVAQSKAANIGDTHAQALERTRRQHGISLEDLKAGEEERKRQQESGKKGSTEEQVAELQKTYNTEKDAEIMRQLLGKSTSGYNAVIKILNNTKVGFDDEY